MANHRTHTSVIGGGGTTRWDVTQFKDPKAPHLESQQGPDVFVIPEVLEKTCPHPRMPDIDTPRAAKLREDISVSHWFSLVLSLALVHGNESPVGGEGGYIRSHHSLSTSGATVTKEYFSQPL